MNFFQKKVLSTIKFLSTKKIKNALCFKIDKYSHQYIYIIPFYMVYCAFLFMALLFLIKYFIDFNLTNIL